MLIPKRFQEVIPTLLQEEGGAANSPYDKGKLTLAGITQATYDRARRKWKLPTRSVLLSTPEEREHIYLEEYWVRGRCGELAAPLDLVHFDSMVQHGRAVSLLQKAVGAKQDGDFGAKTMAAVQAFRGGPLAVSRALLRERLWYYTELALNEGRDDPDKQNLPGWMRRLYRTWGTVEALDYR